MNAKWEFRILILLGIILIFVAGALAKQRDPRRAFAFVLAWLVPGAGHLAMGKWLKGLFLFGLMGATYLFGLWIVGFKSVSFDDNPFYYFGQYGSGATLAISKSISLEKSYPRDGLQPSWYDPGLLYVCVVGLLNLVLMMNVLEIKTKNAAAPDKAEAAPAPSAPDAAPEKTS